MCPHILAQTQNTAWVIWFKTIVYLGNVILLSMSSFAISHVQATTWGTVIATSRIFLLDEPLLLALLKNLAYLSPQLKLPERVMFYYVILYYFLPNFYQTPIWLISLFDACWLSPPTSIKVPRRWGLRHSVSQQLEQCLAYCRCANIFLGQLYLQKRRRGYSLFFDPRRQAFPQNYCYTDPGGRRN